MSTIRIIGVDPGSRSTGYGIVDAGGTRIIHVASGFVKSTDGDWADRLRAIFDGLGAVIDTHAPRELAIE